MTTPGSSNPSNAVLRPRKVIKDYGQQKKPSNSKKAPPEPQPKINQDVFITLPSDQFKQLAENKNFDRKASAKSFNLACKIEEFKWSDKNVLTAPAKVSNKTVSAIVDTRSTSIVISRGCFDRLGLVEDAKVLLTLSSVTNTVMAPRKVFYNVKIQVGRSVTRLPAILAKGLQLNLLLGVNWIAAAKAQININQKTLAVNGEIIQIKTYKTRWVICARVLQKYTTRRR